MYNPYNSNNCLFKKSDINKILSANNCKFTVRDDQLYQRAMVHSSYVKRKTYTTPKGEIIELADNANHCIELFDASYETLEYLGDSILGAVTSTYLFNRFPCENEGLLTDIKKEIVCNEMLGKLSKNIGLERFLIVSRHNEEMCNGRLNSGKLSDIFEAFIGALWIDSNNDFKVVYSFIVSLIEKYVNIPSILLNNKNYKDQLQKIFQAKSHCTPTYKQIGFENNLFEVAVYDTENNIIGVGVANTKKQAEQLAAKNALLKV
jgi:ribonuclease-3